MRWLNERKTFKISLGSQGSQVGAGHCGMGVLLAQADNAKLALDTGKYDMALSKAGDITRYNVTFPVIGPYPQVRQFIDAVLVALPAVSITELNIERKTIVDGQVEARLRLTFYTRSAP